MYYVIQYVDTCQQLSLLGFEANISEIGYLVNCFLELGLNITYLDRYLDHINSSSHPIRRNMQVQEDVEPTVRIRELRKDRVNFVLGNVDLA